MYHTVTQHYVHIIINRVISFTSYGQFRVSADQELLISLVVVKSFDATWGYVTIQRPSDTFLYAPNMKQPAYFLR